MANEKKASQARIYQDLAFGASMEASRLIMIKEKLDAEVELLNALQQYYDRMAELEGTNEGFYGFDLNRL